MADADYRARTDAHSNYYKSPGLYRLKLISDLHARYRSRCPNLVQFVSVVGLAVRNWSSLYPLSISLLETVPVCLRYRSRCSNLVQFVSVIGLAARSWSSLSPLSVSLLEAGPVCLRYRSRSSNPVLYILSSNFASRRTRRDNNNGRMFDLPMFFVLTIDGEKCYHQRMIH